MVGAKTRLWLLRGNTFAVVFFMLISLTPLGVLAGNVLFPPPDIEALAAQASSSAGKPVFEKREKLPFAAIGSGAGISVRRSGPAGGEISPGSAATPKAGMARMEKLSLRVEGMS